MADTTVKEMVARIDERTEWLVCEFKKLNERANLHSRRLGKLETFRAWMIGVGAAIVTLAGLLVKLGKI